jgi:hypothetical protein
MVSVDCIICGHFSQVLKSDLPESESEPELALPLPLGLALLLLLSWLLSESLPDE